MTFCHVERGTSPVILAFPHVGTEVLTDIWERLNANGRQLADTDWHVNRLYRGLLPAATTVRAAFSRYVIDANRDPAGTSLYPGQHTTGLVPETDFDGHPIWRPGAGPTSADVKTRVAAFHAPYHLALSGEIERVRALHGVAVLFDCHSIRSRIPFLFEGTLPDFNLGTNDGQSCSPGIESAVAAVAGAAAGHTSIVNGRFKGGWTTRHYGQPKHGVHALQMELAQSTHLVRESTPFLYDPGKGEVLRGTLRTMLATIERRAHELATGATIP